MKKGTIYKITNLVNGKIYIGQTVQYYLNRFTQHKSHARTGQSNHKLARALRKYGDSNFIIEVIEECDISLLDEKEKYWIKYYNSIEDGYNISGGGQQNRNEYYELENADEIIAYYQACHNQQQTISHFNITEYKFRQLLLKNNIQTDYTNYGKHTREKIKIIELNMEFESGVECAKYLIANNLCSSKKEQCVRVRISQAITNNKKAYGFTFKKVI